MVTQLAVLVLAQVALFGQVATPTPKVDPLAVQIQRAVRQLGDSHFSVRMKASDFLWKSGAAAEAALHGASRSDDREVAYRAKQILRNFEYGIYPDTPDKLASIIVRFRDGDENAKRVALQELQKEGHIQTLLKLLQTDMPDELRDSLVQRFLRDVEQIVPTLLVQGDTEKAEELLNLASTSEAGMRHHATYLLLTDQIDKRIAELRKIDAPTDKQEEFLMYLLRAKGERADAVEVARKDADQRALMYEMNDWQSLAEIAKLPELPPDEEEEEDDSKDDAPNDPGKDDPGKKQEDDPKKPFKWDRLARILDEDEIEELGYTTAYYRLAGEEKKLEQAISLLKALCRQAIAEGETQMAWYCVEALFANRRLDEGLALLKQFKRSTACELLREQERYAEACEVAGIAKDLTNTEEWFKQMADKISKKDSDDEDRAETVIQRLGVGLEVARLLHSLGKKEEAKRGFALLAEPLVKQTNVTYLGQIAQAEFKLAMYEQAFEHSAVVMARYNQPYFLRQLFSKQRESAELLWTHFRKVSPDEKLVDSLKKVHQLLAPWVYGEDSEEESLQWVKDIEAGVGGNLYGDQAENFHILFELSRRFDKDYARTLLTKSADRNHPDALLELGDLQAVEEEWKAAAKTYHAAWKNDSNYPRNTLGLYLSGDALRKSGEAGDKEDAAEGERRIRLARILPFAGTMRRTLADGLRDHGMREQSLDEWHLLTRTAQFNGWDSSYAAQQIGNLVNEENPAGSANHWEKLLLSILKTSSNFLQSSGYLKLPHLIHKAHARAAIAADDRPRAEREIAASLKALPGDVEFGEDLTRDLRAKGWDELADKVYQDISKVLDGVIADFPRSPLHLNNAAWLSALNDSDLDRALTRAKLAVELTPKNPAYIDTLGEVHFRLGNREEALKLARQCLEIRPTDKHFQKQVKRFEAEE